MEKIRFLADAACDIPKETAAKYSIEVLPVMVTWGGQSKAEWHEIDPAEFLQLIQEIDEIPQTAQVTPLAYMEAYKRAYDEGCTHVVSINISSTASGTFQSGLIAKDLFYEEFGNKMEIINIDSRGYSYMFGRMAVEGAKMASEGKSLSEILDRIEDMRLRGEAFFLVYSLKQIKKSGRISGAAAFVGEIMGFRPISHCCCGRIVVIDKVRGDHAVLPKMAEYMSRRIENSQGQIVTLIHGVVPETELKAAEDLINREFKPLGIERILIGPSIAVNTGPHVIAVAFLGARSEA